MPTYFVGGGMHESALLAADNFFDIYCRRPGGRILDIGSMDVNGSLRSVAPAGFEYVGADMAPGAGVDVLLSDPHELPFGAKEFDVVVSSSCFEHMQFFWITFLECLRVLKDDGLLYINAPSNGPYHPYPHDNWRFYPDAGRALAAWGQRQGFKVCMVESFVLNQMDGVWNDYVAIFRKGNAQAPAEWLHSRFPGATNAWTDSSATVLRESRRPEDQRKRRAWRRLLGLR